MLIESTELESIFQQYKGSITQPELLDILDRGYVYSVLEPNRDVLICGINPSYRLNDKNKENYNCFKFDDFKTKEEDKQGYFRKFHEMLGNDVKANYLDIFYQRHTDQREIWKFLKKKEGVDFLCSQLTISQRKIEELKPKLILVFNKLAATFFGKNEKDGHHVWMGYEFAKVDGFENLYQIAGIKQLEGKVDKNLNHTSLKGTYVYFSRYFDRRTKKSIKEQIESDVKQALVISKTL